jgi:serine protease inhibitor
VKFSADRPFFFAITDKVTGTALFVGYVADPGT